jgi:SAM-dependent methyltransferase
MIKLEPTGERMIVDEYHASVEDHLIYLMHMASYAYAEGYAHGKRVLDFGCGSGYGSALIAKAADSVHALDVAQDAIDYARAHFSRPNLEFSRVQPDAQLPFDNGSFDLVLSFQVFEHVRDTGRYLAEIQRVLAPGGRLILITPDRDTRLFPLQRPWNRWHLKEYSQRGLRRILERVFPEVEVMGMSARSDVIGIEIRRCRKLKWLSLPFTLPIIPDAWRVAALNAVHRHRQRGSAVGPPGNYDFTVEDIHIARDASPSVNIVALCKKP